MANNGPLRVTLLDDQTVDETTSQGINVEGYTALAFYVQGEGTINAGVVTLEESVDDPDTQNIYGGTWSSIGTVTASDVSGGKQKATHATVGAYGRVRARISDAIGGGGTVSVVLVAC